MLFSKTILFTIGLPCLVIATENLPKVTLPWGTWQAASLDADIDFYTFRNIRFGNPPNGTARFQISTRPKNISHPEDSLMNNNYGPMCIQANIDPSHKPQNYRTIESEDCLFLDLYVPKSVFEKSKKGTADTPVVVWIYGGGFAGGAKDAYGPDSPFFKGDGLLHAAAKIHEDVIFVAGNYRLGAFGWLAGSEMEKDATANAGLHDQRLLFEWVRDYISKFGGNKNQVSAWGESAGGGSIVHHLLQKNGTRDPLFRRAMVQSPAFQWKWDRAPGGRLDQVYRNFSELANCSTGGINCLVKADVETLKAASQRLYDISFFTNGVLPVGPAIDNDWTSYLPAVAFQKNLYWKELDSLMISHVAFESPVFVPQHIKNVTEFDKFLDHYIHEKSPDNNVRTAIKARYPRIDPLRYFDKQLLRAGVIIQDSTFTCKTRQLFDAYHKTTDTYMLQYYGGMPVHASDLIPTFWIPTIEMAPHLVDWGLDSVMAYITQLMISAIAPVYQRYMAGFAINGNPNLGSKFPFFPWKPAVSLDGNILMNVLKVQSLGPLTFDVNTIDLLNTKNICDFWTTVEYDMSGQVRKLEAEPVAQPEYSLQKPLEL